MYNLSMIQALGIWSELEQAYYGDNGYGSETAEIYVYRAMPYSPTAHSRCSNPESSLAKEATTEVVKNANMSLYNLFKMFAKLRHCVITVEGRPLGKWVITSENGHRWHVHVKSKRLKNHAN